MGIFERAKRMTKKSAVAPAKETKAKKEVSSSAAVPATPRRMSRNEQVLIAPHVSEKAATLASRGVYVFDVPLSANKIEVRKAVESLWSVNVETVRIVRGMGKRLTRGRVRGQRNDWKKALVSVRQGQTIDLYAGV